MLTKEQIHQVVAFDHVWREEHVGNGRTVRYVLIERKENEELCLVTVAVKIDKKTGKILIKDVARKDTETGTIRVRDMGYYGGAGWLVYWKKADYEHGSFTAQAAYGMMKEGEERWYDINLRKPEESFPFAYDPIVNPGFMAETKYKWCGFDSSSGKSIGAWIEMYRHHPKVELLGKAGIGGIACKSILDKLEKDKAFMRFISQNVERCKKARPSEVMWAFRNGKTIDEARFHMDAHNEMIRMRFPKSFLNRCDKVYAHSIKSNISIWEYANYARYAERAGWDCEDEHILYPPKKSFAERLEYAEKCAHKVEKRLANMAAQEKAKKIKACADLYSAVAEVKGADGLSAWLPKCAKDFKREGNAMGNCVGSMSYDGKMARGESVLVFIRKNGKPFVDVEIDMTGKVPKIRQCYGRKNGKASPEANAVAEKALSIVQKEVRRLRRGGFDLVDGSKKQAVTKDNKKERRAA